MKQIVDDILDLSKLHTDTLKLSKQSLELNAVLKPIYESFIYSFKNKEVGFRLIENPEKVVLKVDLLYFERALNNILLNALKFTEEGHVTISSEFENNELELTIEDTGVGIGKGQLSKIFSEFYQVENDINKAGGSGVGLSFSKSVIELHGGVIEVESELGRGTSFKIKLPAWLSTNHKVLEKDLSEPVPVRSKVANDEVTILVVEDHPEMRAYIRSLLTGYHILEAGNGLEALEVLSNHTVDFIVTDYMMPKMDGYEFIKSLKQKNTNIPVIVLTARADTGAKLRVLRLGIDDYLIKPFNPDELLVRIQNSLNNYKERLSYLSEQESDPKNVRGKEGFVNELSRFIEDNCSNELFNLDMVREEFALSTSSLYRKVKSETGLSPIEFVKEVRLQKVRRIVERNPNVTLKSLAVEAGIANVSYFKKQYFDRFGKDFSS